MKYGLAGKVPANGGFGSEGTPRKREKTFTYIFIDWLPYRVFRDWSNKTQKKK